MTMLSAARPSAASAGASDISPRRKATFQDSSKGGNMYICISIYLSLPLSISIHLSLSLHLAAQEGHLI